MNCLLVNCQLHGEGEKNFYDIFVLRIWSSVAYTIVLNLIVVSSMSGTTFLSCLLCLESFIVFLHQCHGNVFAEILFYLFDCHVFVHNDFNISVMFLSTRLAPGS